MNQILNFGFVFDGIRRWDRRVAVRALQRPHLGNNGHFSAHQLALRRAAERGRRVRHPIQTETGSDIGPF